MPTIHDLDGADGLHESKTALPIPDSSKGNTLIQELIQKEMTAAALLIQLDPLELMAWMNLFEAIPEKTWLCMLRLIQEYRLDPLKEELFLNCYDNGHWQVLISIDGWIKLISRHPYFVGIVFTESSQLLHDVPTWIECAIYRSDRTIPMVVREYFIEVKNETPIWQKMPRRMLRHRALQQCARLSFGIALHDTSFSQPIPKPAELTSAIADTQMTTPIGALNKTDCTGPAYPVQHEKSSPSRMKLLKAHLEHRASP